MGPTNPLQFTCERRMSASAGGLRGTVLRTHCVTAKETAGGTVLLALSLFSGQAEERLLPSPFPDED